MLHKTYFRNDVKPDELENYYNKENTKPKLMHFNSLRLGSSIPLSKIHLGFSPVSTRSLWSLLLCFVLLPALQAEEVCPGNVRLSTQAEVDACTCTKIEGSLTIGKNGTSSNITDLSKLFELSSVGGDLKIFNNRSLSSLSGLEGISSVVGYLDIGYNRSLVSLSGLEGVSSVGGYLKIRKNESLKHLSGLEGISSVGGYLDIGDNHSLVSLSGLEGVSSVGSYLIIYSNSKLADCCVLPALIKQAEEKGVGVGINDNGYGCESAEAITKSCSTLVAPTVYEGDLYISSQLQLDACNYREITGQLVIDESREGSDDEISSVQALAALKKVGGGVTIANNAALVDLAGLDQLEEIGGSLSITNNARLSDISALVNLQKIETKNEVKQLLEIIENPSLSDCCSIAPLLSRTIATNPYIRYKIWENQSQCSSMGVLLQSCQPSGVPETNTLDHLRNTTWFSSRYHDPIQLQIKEPEQNPWQLSFVDEGDEYSLSLVKNDGKHLLQVSDDEPPLELNRFGSDYLTLIDPSSNEPAFFFVRQERLSKQVLADTRWIMDRGLVEMKADGSLQVRQISLASDAETIEYEGETYKGYYEISDQADGSQQLSIFIEAPGEAAPREVLRMERVSYTPGSLLYFIEDEYGDYSPDEYFRAELLHLRGLDR